MTVDVTVEGVLWPWADVRIISRKMEIIDLASPECQKYGLLSETCKKGSKSARCSDIFFSVLFVCFTHRRRQTNLALVIDLPKTKLV